MFLFTINKKDFDIDVLKLEWYNISGRKDQTLRRQPTRQVFPPRTRYVPVCNNGRWGELARCVRPLRGEGAQTDARVRTEEQHSTAKRVESLAIPRAPGLHSSVFAILRKIILWRSSSVWFNQLNGFFKVVFFPPIGKFRTSFLESYTWFEGQFREACKACVS